jgi:hypothetical protein
MHNEIIKERESTDQVEQVVSPSHRASNQAASSLIYPAPTLQPQTQTGQEYHNNIPIPPLAVQPLRDCRVRDYDLGGHHLRYCLQLEAPARHT